MLVVKSMKVKEKLDIEDDNFTCFCMRCSRSDLMDYSIC